MTTFDKFLNAQELFYEQALREIKAGKKEGHWIWFVFPQLKGLGKSNNSRFYGISSIDEARDYYEHPVLGKRLKKAANTLLKSNKSAQEIFGELDAMKVRSCMTLFKEVVKYSLEEEDEIFWEVLKKFYAGKTDRLTKELISAEYEHIKQKNLSAINDRSYRSIYEKVKAYVRADERYKDIWWHLHNVEMNIRQKFITEDFNIRVALLFAYLHEEKFGITVESLRNTLLKDLSDEDYFLLNRACKLHKKLGGFGDAENPFTTSECILCVDDTTDICADACRLDLLLKRAEVKSDMATFIVIERPIDYQPA